MKEPSEEFGLFTGPTLHLAKCETIVGCFLRQPVVQSPSQPVWRRLNCSVLLKFNAVHSFIMSFNVNGNQENPPHLIR